MIPLKLSVLCQLFLFSKAMTVNSDSLFVSKISDGYIRKVINEELRLLEGKMKESFDLKLQHILDEQEKRTEKLRENDLKHFKEMEIMMKNQISKLQLSVDKLMLKCGYDQKHTIDQSYDINQESIMTSANTETNHSWDHTKETNMGSPTKAMQNRAIKPPHREARLLLETMPPATESSVGFYAYLSKNEATSGPHHTLIFDYVESNIGNSYSKHTGVFTVPLDGIYLFTYTIFNEQPGYGSFEIVVNSTSRGAIFVDNSASPHAFTGTTGVAVIHVSKGDACYVRTHSSYQGVGIIRSDSYMRTSFTGVRIGH